MTTETPIEVKKIENMPKVEVTASDPKKKDKEKKKDKSEKLTDQQVE